MSIDYKRTRERVAVEDVLRLIGWEPTKKYGVEWRGSCPLPEHVSTGRGRGSFAIDVGQGRWQCFKCEKRGGIFDLWRMMTGQPLHEAVRSLCEALEIEPIYLPTRKREMTTEMKERGAGNLSLPELAAEANRHHQCALDAGTAMIEHAREAGEHLLAAKSKCAHGEWGAWLDKNCEFSERTAQRYMRVAQRWPELETAAKTTRVSDLPIRDALAMLAEPPRPNGKPAPVDTTPAPVSTPRATPTRPAPVQPTPAEPAPAAPGEAEDLGKPDDPLWLHGTRAELTARRISVAEREWFGVLRKLVNLGDRLGETSAEVEEILGQAAKLQSRLTALLKGSKANGRDGGLK